MRCKDSATCTGLDDKGSVKASRNIKVVTSIDLVPDNESHPLVHLASPSDELETETPVY